MLWDPCGDEVFCEGVRLTPRLTTRLTMTDFCGTKEVLAIQKMHCYTKKMFYEASLRKEAVVRRTKKRGKS